MNQLNLKICGGEEFSLDEIREVPTPEPQKRWYPIPHIVLIDKFLEQAKDQNLQIKQSYLTLARDGLRFFGLFEVGGILSTHGDEVGTVVGLRNTHDQSFAAGICAGCAPFVCTNLVFSNEITLGRRHTLRILSDLPFMIAKAIGRLSDHWKANDRRIDAYKSFELENVQAHHLAVELYRHGAITKTQIASVVEQWHEPEFPEFQTRNGWSFYNGISNVLRGNLGQLNNRSDALHGFLDPQFGAFAIDV